MSFFRTLEQRLETHNGPIKIPENQASGGLCKHTFARLWGLTYTFKLPLNV